VLTFSELTGRNKSKAAANSNSTAFNLGLTVFFSRVIPQRAGLAWVQYRINQAQLQGQQQAQNVMPIAN